MNRKLLIAPSILSADFANLSQSLHDAEAAGADWIHIDVMDGHFVPNLTIGPPVVQMLRPHTSLPLDVHLMVERPEQIIPAFVAAGANILTVHWEACPHLHRVVQQVRQAGASPGVVVNPATPVTLLTDILPFVDVVLVMSVNPGFGGQKFIPQVAEKVKTLVAMRQERKLGFLIEVDGGIGPANARALVMAGANVLVAGTALFRATVGIRQALPGLRAIAEGSKT